MTPLNKHIASIKFIATFILFIVLTGHIHAQQQAPYGAGINWLSGYQKTIAGEVLTYYSAFPDYVNRALLTRCTDGAKTIEWETAAVPPDLKKEYVYFRWIASHSTGTSGGSRQFDFYIDNEKALTFATQPGNKNPVWRFSANDSTQLTFVRSKTDGVNDAHGIAYLRVPRTRLKPGQPLQLKVVGQAEKSNDWFMTFEYAFEQKADVTVLPFLYHNGKQPVLVTILHFGKSEKLKVRVEKELHSFDLKEGINTFEIPVTASKDEKSLQVQVGYGKTELCNKTLLQQPITYRELDFIHHSHTDIGYSHLQPEVERIHTKNIYDALVMIERTKNYPPEARFKWNVESLWAVENFMKKATPAEQAQFIGAVKQGAICLSGLYANILTGLSMPEEMLHYTDYAEQLRRQYQLPIGSAMISDVPGLAWATVAGLSKGGIRYLSSGPNYVGPNNPYLGDRVGHFVKSWGDKPVWWQSPSGKEKLLFWAGGKGYSSWHGTAPGAIFENGPKKIAAYLQELDAANYPYELVQWRYNCVADNGPIDSTVSDFVKQWNERYASPKIVLNTTDQLFETFEKRYGAQLPVLKGDITPYWEDGAASTAAEEGQNRANSLRLQQLTTLYAMLAPEKYNATQFYEAWKNLLLFHEHTWGAHNSISQPTIPFVTEQWRIKKDFMLAADETIHALSGQLLPQVSESTKKIAVVNTLSWARSGPVYLPADFRASSIKDEQGKLYPVQQLANGSRVFMASGLKPLGVTYFSASEARLKIGNPFVLTDSSVSNGHAALQWDKTGSIVKFTDQNGYNYSGEFDMQGLNAYWYVAGRNPATAVSNGACILRVVDQGPLLCTIEFSTQAHGAENLVRSITLLANEETVLIKNTIDKIAVQEKEGVYFSFPFNANLQHTTLDVGYGTMDYLKDQLPGSNMDFVSTKRWLDASDAKHGMQLLMIEPFMASPGEMVDERLAAIGNCKTWRTSGTPASTWFSYVMNNYWHTNYKADQQGETKFRYALRPHGPLQGSEQEKAAMELMQPLVVFGADEKASAAASLFELDNTKIVVTSITPTAKNEFVIRFFNPENSTQQTGIKWLSLKPINGLTELKLDAYEIKEVGLKIKN